MLKRKTIARMLIFIVAIAVFVFMLPAGVALAATVTAIGTSGTSSGTVGSTVTVTGSGFPASTSGTVIFASNTIYASSIGVTSDSNGSISTIMQIPPAPANLSYQIVVTVGAVTASTPFSIVPAVNLGTSIVQVGAQLAVTGAGFTPNYPITIRYDGTVLPGATSNSYGSFGPVYFTVPASTNTSHSVSATDGIYSVYATLTVQASVTITPNSASVGDTITIGGSGFGAYRAVTITFDTITLSTVPTTDANGSFSTTFAVPSSTSRSISVSANDGIVSASASFGLVAGLRVNPTSGVVGASVAAVGTGFGSSRSVTVSLDGTQVALGTTDSNGGFNANLSIPAATGGAHTLSAYDGVFSASATFNVSAQVKTSPNNGAAGTQVTVNGNGFGSGGAITVNFDAGQVANGTSDASGTFSISFAVPASVGGNHSITATDGTNTSNGQFTTTASAALDPKSGPTGVQVTVSAQGFKANTAVAIRFNNVQIKSSNADANGSFSDKFVVPDVDAGNYSVVASDGTNAATIGFSVTSSMRIDPTGGNVGSPITVTGTGFAGTVTVKYDGATLATTTADVNGAFTATFNAPVSLHGNHVIVAGDASTTLQRSFAMDATPPPVPQPLTPLTTSVQNARPTFTWTGVTDPSGVSYALQVAADPSFTVILLQKQELSAAQYKVQGAESLKATGKDSPYYWRVKATDQASNESAFSSPNSFSVSVFPAWAMWLLIVVGAIIVLLVVLYVGVRIGRRTTD